MTNLITDHMGQSDDDINMISVPHTAIMENKGGDPFFALFKMDDHWRWRFFDETGHARCEGCDYWSSIKESLADIRSMQRRMGNTETPILRVI